MIPNSFQQLLQVASVTDNLISGQTMTFVSLTVGSRTFESKVKAVKSRQQFIEFEEDFTCAISDEALTIRTPSEDGSPTSTAIPILVKLHRKGLIDSEVIASGKILLPMESTAIDNISVGLFQVDEERAEIAIAKLSVVINLGERDKGGLIGAIVEEMEHMMLEYSRGRVGSSTDLSDSLQRFFTAVTPLRRLIEQVSDLVTWKRSYVSSWLFLLTIFLFPPLGLFVSVLVNFCVSFQVPLPLLRFIPANTLDPPKEGPETPQQSVELNVLFLARLMNRMVRWSYALARLPSALYVLLILTAIYTIPLHCLILCVMAYHTFLVQALLTVLGNRFSFFPKSVLYERLNSTEGEVIVTENQRWWFGKWSDKLIGEEAHPWTDSAGRPIVSKDSVHNPPGTEWSSKWLVADTADQEQGWMYGRDFKTKLMNPTREIADFVRSRRWVRTYKPRNQQVSN